LTGARTLGLHDLVSGNYQRYTSVSSPTVDAQPIHGLAIHCRPGAFGEDWAQPDLSIAVARHQDELRYPSYTVIHLVTADEIPVCVIQVSPTIMTS
jgi:hypothetical protein